MEMRRNQDSGMLLAVWLLALAFASPLAGQAYQIIDLDPEFSRSAINGAGQIACSFLTEMNGESTTRACVWQAGDTTIVGDLIDVKSDLVPRSGALGINNAGQIVGWRTVRQVASRP